MGPPTDLGPATGSMSGRGAFRAVCDCGFVAEGDDAATFLATARAHALSAHGIEPGDAALLASARRAGHRDADPVTATTTAWPAGWYVVHDGNGLGPGHPVAVEALGGRLLLERRSGGGVRVRTGSGAELPVDGLGGAVAVWSGAEPPPYRLGPFPELGERRWSGVRWAATGVVRTTVANAQRDVVDNAHFEPVHGLRNPETRAADRGHAFDTVSQGVISLRRIGGPPLLAHLRLDGRLHGPGLLAYRTTITAGIQIHNLLFSAVTPIDAERSRFFAGIAVRRLRVPVLDRLILRSAIAGLLQDYDRDAAYWAAGRPRPPEAGPETEEEQAMGERFERWLDRCPAGVPAAG